MKHSLLAALFLFAGHALAETPKIDATKAARIATDYLAKRGSAYVVSVSLDKSSLINGSPSWIARWSEPIQDGQNREVGARIKMDGSIVGIVDNPADRMERATRRPILR